MPSVALFFCFFFFFSALQGFIYKFCNEIWCMRYNPDGDQIQNNINANSRATAISNQWKIHDWKAKPAIKTVAWRYSLIHCSKENLLGGSSAIWNLVNQLCFHRPSICINNYYNLITRERRTELWNKSYLHFWIYLILYRIT